MMIWIDLLPGAAAGDGALQYFCDDEGTGGWIGAGGCVWVKEACVKSAWEDGSKVSSSEEL
jgi:hypothetical protein